MPMLYDRRLYTILCEFNTRSYRYHYLDDALSGIPYENRVQDWSNYAAHGRVFDGPLNVSFAEDLAAASLCKNDVARLQPRYVSIRTHSVDPGSVMRKSETCLGMT